jgi:hypothetical protein
MGREGEEESSGATEERNGAAAQGGRLQGAVTRTPKLKKKLM